MRLSRTGGFASGPSGSSALQPLMAAIPPALHMTETLIALIALLVVILPFVALGMAATSLSRANALRRRFDDLQREVHELRRRAAVAGFEEPLPGHARSSLPPPAAALGTPAEPSAQRTAPAPPEAGSPAEPPPIPKEGAGAAKPPGHPVPAPSPAPLSPAPARRRIDWEHFMGARLFAWVGGFALFLAVAFFVKFSFDRDLIPPEVRIALGYLAGGVLLGGGVMLARRRDYTTIRVTAHTLCGTGVVALYAVTFAARSVYHFPFFGPLPTMLLMSLVTVTAFLVAARLDAVGVAVLGLLGGFLTPSLVSPEGKDPAALFSYIALLDLGLLALVLRKRWDWLATAAAIGTTIVQFAWIDRSFRMPQFALICAIALGFAVLFAGAYFVARRSAGAAPSGTIFVGSQIPSWAAILLVLVAVVSWRVGDESATLLGTLFMADGVLLSLAAARSTSRWLEPAATAAAFVTLGIWTVRFGSDDRLAWLLAAPLLFGLVHIAFPVLVQRRQPERGFGPWSLLLPVLTLVLLAVPVFSADLFSVFVWGAVALVVLGAAVLALAAGSAQALAVTLLAACVFIAVWMIRIPRQAISLGEVLAVIGGFGLVFLVLGTAFASRILSRADALGDRSPDRWNGSRRWMRPEIMMEATPVMAAMLPFLLLALAIGRVALVDPSPVFGLALLLGCVLLGLCRISGREWLAAAGLAATLLVEHAWFVRHFDPAHAAVPLAWFVGFCALYAAFPFVALRGRRMAVPWVASALSGPGHFFLVHSLVKSAWPNDMMGLLPAAFAVPAIVALLLALGNIPADHPRRNAVLASFGGAALLFITLIFPIQFEREWLTTAWALEGAALLWLFHRIPHAGLRLVGLALLATAFVRLALNPAVLSYHPRAATPILNWYLLTYGIVIASLAFGARMLRSPAMRLLHGRIDARALLAGAATILGFLLLNLEIADFFTPAGSRVLTFEFEGSLARDMTYSIAWACFAFGLLVAGILRRIRAARIAGIALMALTLVKLFLHDMAALEQLYRIGALVGVAVVAIVASFLYQKLMRPEDGGSQTGPPPDRNDSASAATKASE